MIYQELARQQALINIAPTPAGRSLKRKIGYVVEKDEKDEKETDKRMKVDGTPGNTPVGDQARQMEMMHL